LQKVEKDEVLVEMSLDLRIDVWKSKSDVVKYFSADGNITARNLNANSICANKH
jgi:hypothetical protein